MPRKKDTVSDLQKIVHRTGRLLKGCRVLRDTMATNQSSFIPLSIDRDGNDGSLVREPEFTWDMVFLEMSALLQKGA